MKNIPDVIIVGGGIIGLSCAFYLAKNKIPVTILEKDSLGSASTVSSLGILAPPSPLKQTSFHSVHRKSLEMFPGFVADIKKYSNLDPNYNRCGSLEILPTRTQLEQALKEVAYCREHEILFGGRLLLSIITPDDLSKLEPLLYSSSFGALCNHSSAIIDVEKLVCSLQNACLQLGVNVLEKTVATSLIYDNDAVIGVDTDNGKKFSTAVLVTAGAWTSQLDDSLKTYAYMEPIKGQALSIETTHSMVKHIIKWKRHYLVPTTENALTLGVTTERNVGFNTSNTIGGIKKILNTTTELCPSISECKILKTWAGLRPAGADRKPHIGPVPGMNNLYVATGHYKIGIGFAPITAQLITDYLTKETTDLDAEILLPRRAARLKKGDLKRTANG